MNELPPIPDMIDPLSKAWDQPKKENIQIMMGHAWMSKETFDKLHEYSCSNPTAIYAGKMWKAIYDIRNKATKKIEKKAYLKFVTPDKEDGYFLIHPVPIMINK